jgi:hypothetical protein
MALASDPQMLRDLCEERRVWEGQLRAHRLMWGEAWKRWRIVPLRQNERRDPDNRFRSQTHVPYGFHHVETAVPRIVGSDPRMSYRALDLADDTPVAHIQSGVASWQMERMNFKLHLKRFGRQGLVTGYTAAKVGWVRSVKDKTYTERAAKWDPHLRDMFTVEEQRQSKVVVKNSPFFDTVNNIDFVFPIECRDLDECPAVWQRRRVKLGYLRKMQKDGVYQNVDQVKGMTSRTSDSSSITQTWWRDQYDQQAIVLGNLGYGSDDDRSEVDLWERWEDDRLTVIAEGGGEPVLLRDVPNPFWHGMKPFCDYAPYPENLQMPGQGMIAILDDLNESLDTLRRQRDDALAYIINPVFKGRGVDPDQMELFPGAYIEVDDLNDLTPLFVPQIDFAASERNEERIILDMQDISGMSAALSGSTSDAGQVANTATGVQSVTSESNKRAEEMIDELAQRAMKRFGVMLASMNAQFLDGDVAADFSKDPGAMQAWLEFQQAENPDQAVTPLPSSGIVVVNADWLKAKGRLEPIPKVGQDEEQSKLQRRSDATQYVNALTPFLGMVPCPVNVKSVIGYVSEQYDIPSDVRDQILNNTPEIQAAAAEQAQQQAQQQPPQNGSGPSGPGGENLPTGLGSGAPGVSGG